MIFTHVLGISFSYVLLPFPYAIYSSQLKKSMPFQHMLFISYFFGAVPNWSI